MRIGSDRSRATALDVGALQGHPAEVVVAESHLCEADHVTGLRQGVRQRRRPEVLVDGDSIVCDYDGTDPQVDRAINCAMCYTYAMMAYAVKCIAAPDLPIERILQGDMGRSTYFCPKCQPPKSDAGGDARPERPA